MPLPKLSPLQSRLAASVVASCMLLLLYFTFSSPHFAYAADVDSIRPEDHNHERLLDTSVLEEQMEDWDMRDYIPEFLGVDRGILGRQANSDDPSPLMNNIVIGTNIAQGTLVSYVFTNSSLWGDKSAKNPGLPRPSRLNSKSLSKKGAGSNEVEDELEQDEAGLQHRQSGPQNRTLYITVTTCLQPAPIRNTTTDPPPQLRLYVSTSQNNTKPGPGKDPSKQREIQLSKGYGSYNINATGDVFIGVYGENTTDYKNVWNAQIAASIDAPFHTYQNFTDPNLYMVDSDSQSALLVTDNLVDKLTNESYPELYEQWMNMSSPPYSVFLSPVDNINLKGIEYSYCAWNNFAQIGAIRPGDVGPSKLQQGMTSRGVEDLPKEQFYMDGLSPGTVYNAVLAMKGNSTAEGDGVVGGGGQIWPVMNFTTMQNGNCGVIFNLSFCSDSAYAVPSNPNKFPNMSSLAAFYDNYTQAYYSNFQKVLAQTPCETTSSAKYSLARTCEDCAIAYKRWLCTVTIPRCTDFSSTHPWVVPRAMGQPFPGNRSFLPDDLRAMTSPSLRNSRNPLIDEKVIPGPYKEVLPCHDLCYGVVQSCPASMGFGCPLPGDMGFNLSYGTRPVDETFNDKSTQITCNYPGVSYFKAAGERTTPPFRVFGLSVLMVMVLMVI